MQTLSEWFPLFLQRHPTLVRHAVRTVEAIFPKAAPVAFISSAKAVHEVFSRPEDFLMGYLNAPKLKLGSFLLGMDPCPQHRSERERLTRVLCSAQQRLTNFIDGECQGWAARAAQPVKGDALELASGYAEPIFVRAVGRCFGIPVGGVQSAHLLAREDRSALSLMIRTLGTTIASQHPAPFGLERLAKDVARELDEHLRFAIALHRKQAEGSTVVEENVDAGSVIGQLCAAGDSDDDIVRCVGGMMSAGAGFPKAFAHALHELIEHGKLAELDAAARAGDSASVHGYVREALRFRPVFPFLVRYCPRPARLCDPPTARQREIPAGTLMKIAPLTAMFDKSLVTRPEAFIPTRPASVYCLFGRAPRNCIGEDFIMSLFMPMFRELVAACPDLLLLSKAGRFRYDGAAIEHYFLPLTPDPALAKRSVRPGTCPAADDSDLGLPRDPGGEPLPANLESVAHPNASRASFEPPESVS